MSDEDQSSMKEMSALSAGTATPMVSTLRQRIEADIDAIASALIKGTAEAEARIASLTQKLTHPLLADYLDKPITEAKEFFGSIAHHLRPMQ